MYALSSSDPEIQTADSYSSTSINLLKPGEVGKNTTVCICIWVICLIRRCVTECRDLQMLELKQTVLFQCKWATMSSSSLAVPVYGLRLAFDRNFLTYKVIYEKLASQVNEVFSVISIFNTVDVIYFICKDDSQL